MLSLNTKTPLALYNYTWRFLGIFCMILNIYIPYRCFSQNNPKINIPVTTYKGAENQFGYVELLPNESVSWSISSGGQIIFGQNEPIVYFNCGNGDSVQLTATLQNGLSTTQTLYLRTLVGSSVSGDYPVGANTNVMFSLVQVLRGERIKLSSIVGANGNLPKLSVFDAQGRLIDNGDSLDFIATVRGTYLVEVRTSSPCSIRVRGVRQVVSGVVSPFSTTYISDSASNSASLTELWRTNQFTSGEAMVSIGVGDLQVATWYDIQNKHSVIQGFHSDGMVAWQWTSEKNEYFRTLVAGPHGSVAAIGRSGGPGPDEDSVLMVTISNDGNLLKRTAFATPGYDYGFGLSFFSNGLIAATGFTSGNLNPLSNQGNLDVFVFTIRPNGQVASSVLLGTSQEDRAFACRVVNDTLLVFGDTEGSLGGSTSSNGETDLFMAAFDSSLNQLWVRQFGSAGNDLAFDCVADDSSSDVYLTGMTTGDLANTGYNPETPQVFTLRFNPATRNIVWSRQTGPVAGQSAESLVMSSLGVATLFYTNGSYLGAENNSKDFRSSDDMVVVVYSRDGNQIWLNQFDNTFERIFARAISAKGDTFFVLRDHVYAINRPFSTTSFSYFILNKHMTSINNNSQNSNYIIYPNPANNLLFVPKIHSSLNININILNSNGSLVIQTNELPVEISKLSRGLYFIQIREGNNIFFSKFIKE